MKKKFMAWCAEPWTNGTYLKLCGVASLLSAVIVAAFQIYERLKWGE